MGIEPQVFTADPSLVVDMAISTAEFQTVAGLVARNFGIHLADGKKAMMGCRLVKEVRRSGCRSFAEFYREFLVDPSPETLSMLANALSTNHTYFNRESNHFWMFRDEVLPEVLRQQERLGRRDLRVWCAAASTGEEPYTLAMLIRDALLARGPGWRGGLLATDLSHEALQ
ncbi:MAG TPA: chemotaxis protein CheR, partial [Deltaproteobacteria bacterium]|nr:chemotaxis protein CheR [Deltaproteobacteria bacterium]